MVKTPVTQRNPCYSAVSALLTNPLPDRSKLFATFVTPTTSLVLQQSVRARPFTEMLRRRLILHCYSLYCRIQSGTLEKCSALRKLNNKQRQVSMFLILLLKLLTQFPFVSFLSISILSLLPFSILSLLPLHHAFFLF